MSMTLTIRTIKYIQFKETPHKLARIFLTAVITRGKKTENSSDGSVTIEMKAECSARSWIGSIY